MSGVGRCLPGPLGYQFQIPMRGNEWTGGLSRNIGTPLVSNPHEG